MKIYDLDKTQEWLNRTIQLNQPPPIRGGLVRDGRQIRHFAATVGIAAVILLLMILWPRSQAISTSSVARGPLDHAKIAKDSNNLMVTMGQVPTQSSVIPKRRLPKDQTVNFVGTSVPPSVPIFLDDVNVSGPKSLRLVQLLRR